VAGRSVELFNLVKNFISTDYLKVKKFNVVSQISYICFFYSYNKTTVDVRKQCRVLSV